ncbi:chalcone isomerase family protein [Ramlibacter sp.]|uniref:chalcone isomerase family protein n=1 Tax=Ramlibacter sp. TaxID=1917967 RepID=UPI003D12C657
MLVALAPALAAVPARAQGQAQGQTQAQAGERAVAPWRQQLSEPRLHGSARLTWFGLHVYDAKLWAARGFDPLRPDEHAFALELTYARAFSGRDIAARSLVEMKRAGDIDPGVAARWEQSLAALLPDVKPGDRIAGVHRPGRGASFFHNDRFLGDTADPRFATRFFAIWLGPDTSEPAMRARLLGRP